MYGDNTYEIPGLENDETENGIKSGCYENISNGSRILRIIVMTSKSLEKENIPGTDKPIFIRISQTLRRITSYVLSGCYLHESTG